MLEITVLSGKGGTGKTSITGALVSLSESAVICDNDVDAADLHILLQPEVIETNTFFSGWNVVIDKDKCISCGNCESVCRFDAVFGYPGEGFNINPYQCEGCRLCERLCPSGAILSERNNNNYWYVSDTQYGTMVHAQMGPGEENSGKLVSEIRKKAYEIALSDDKKYIINDGPPGIGCSTIASLTGTNRVLLVIEPTKSGLHDVKRLIDLIESFGIKAFAIVNKFDINLEMSKSISDFLKAKSIPVLANIPFDKNMVNSMVNGKTIVEYDPDSEISELLKDVWIKITDQI